MLKVYDYKYNNWIINESIYIKSKHYYKYVYVTVQKWWNKNRGDPNWKSQEIPYFFYKLKISPPEVQNMFKCIIGVWMSNYQSSRRFYCSNVISNQFEEGVEK